MENQTEEEASSVVVGSVSSPQPEQEQAEVVQMTKTKLVETTEVTVTVTTEVPALAFAKSIETKGMRNDQDADAHDNQEASTKQGDVEASDSKQNEEISATNNQEEDGEACDNDHNDEDADTEKADDEADDEAEASATVTATTNAIATTTATTEEVQDEHVAVEPVAEVAATEEHEHVDTETAEEELEPALAVVQPAVAFAPTSIPPTISYPVNEMEVVTNRGGRSGSLSKFLDDSDIFRRKSLTTFPDEATRESLHQKKMTLDSFLGMAIDPILEALDDADSDIRAWLMQSETVESVLREFAKPPCFTGEPHEEYGYYKNYFICSEIIMKLYTGEEDLYESFSSDSSSGSTTSNTVFGCQDSNDIHKWELLYSIFDNPAPLDEMQLLFFSKALVRLHDGFCLEDGYVTNVLSKFLPRIMPHMYSSTIKYMLTLILQSYESVHPITGRNDAMEIILPLLVQATHLDVTNALNPPAVENASHLLVDMLQANQADRLGSFCRREGGVYLSKYFVRDQFGTIRGFESMTHGYHNFLQFMLLEELTKHKEVIIQVFENAIQELESIRKHEMKEAAESLNIQAATELLCLYKKNGVSTSGRDGDDDAEHLTPVHEDFGYPPSDDLFTGSPRPSTSESTMYSLSTLSDADTLWSAIMDAGRTTAQRFCEQFDAGLPSSVEISVAKHLLTLVQFGDDEIDKQLHEGRLMERYLRLLERRPTFDMLHIHVTPAIDYVIKDNSTFRSDDRVLLADLFNEKNAVPLSRIFERAGTNLPALKVYAEVIKDSIDDVLSNSDTSESRATLCRLCKEKLGWTPPEHPPQGADVDANASMSGPKHLAQIQEDEAVTEIDYEDVDDDDDESVAQRVNVRRPGSDPTADRWQGTQPPLRRSASTREPDQSKEENDNDSNGAPRNPSFILKQMLQTPVFRMSSAKKPNDMATPPPPPPPPENPAQRGAAGSFGWNSMLKRIRQSFVAVHSPEKNEKKMLPLTHEQLSASVQGNQTEVLVVDTSKGEDVTKLVHRDTRVTVSDVQTTCRSPSNAAASASGTPNVLTSGFMYKNKLPDTGQRNLWERYFFVLDRADCSMSYYVSESHAKDRTFLRGTARLVSVSEGIPVSVKGAQKVYGFQINTQGHGAFMVIVDSIDTRLLWLTQILAAVNASHPPSSMKRLSIVATDDISAPMSSPTGQTWTRQQLKDVVTDLYKNLFGPQLRFSTPMDAPASFWMEEKIDPVSESCVLRSNLPDCVPFWGEYHGYKRMCDFWRTRDETIERSNGRVLRIVIDEEEETAVVMTSTTYRILRNSQIVTEESSDILNLSGGVIVSIYCTFDSYRIAEAFQSDGISAS